MWTKLPAKWKWAGVRQNHFIENWSVTIPFQIFQCCFNLFTWTCEVTEYVFLDHWFCDNINQNCLQIVSISDALSWLTPDWIICISCDRQAYTPGGEVLKLFLMGKGCVVRGLKCPLPISKDLSPSKYGWFYNFFFFFFFFNFG